MQNEINCFQIKLNKKVRLKYCFLNQEDSQPYPKGRKSFELN